MMTLTCITRSPPPPPRPLRAPARSDPRAQTFLNALDRHANDRFADGGAAAVERILRAWGPTDPDFPHPQPAYLDMAPDDRRIWAAAFRAWLNGPGGAGVYSPPPAAPANASTVTSTKASAPAKAPAKRTAAAKAAAVEDAPAKPAPRARTATLDTPLDTITGVRRDVEIGRAHV